MMQSTKTIGYMLAGFSIILIIILAVVKLDIDKQNTLLCQTFHEQGLDVTQSPSHKGNISWVLLLAFSVAFLMLGTGIYLLFFLKQATAPMKKEFKHIDLGKLDEDEKKIYDIIWGKDGSAYQTDLIKETGFSKVKITRILDRLESKDILERKRRGMTNIIVLK